MKNDLISRQEAIELIERMKPYHQDTDDIAEMIANMPAAQSESKTGKWIEAYDPFNRISGRCSVCGWEAHLYEDDVVGMNYCPNCGAEMEKIDD